ncbi:MAG: tRNA (adenosine(37)-N6)-threonylcarbamoyltransferase complex transferase subunit TsaD [Planctomycetota bacterium]
MNAAGCAILGIETSCDETAAAVVVDGVDIRSNCIHSQIALHERYRGVVPEVASRSHMNRIVPIITAALEEAGMTPRDLSAVAVTARPGMIGSLLVGLSAAKALAFGFELPLIGIDHVAAHVHAAFMSAPQTPLPLLSLVASGGHTALYLVRRVGHAERIGTTIDDAAGEALDKGAALLGLPYPGGPAIERCARDGDRNAVELPRSMLGKDSLDFSFSGLKTALLYHLRGPGLTRELPQLDDRARADLAASLEEAVVDALVRKLRRAVEQYPEVRSLAIGGGVARNLRLRERLASDRRIGALAQVFPPMALCSDNGAMIAGLGHHRFVVEGQCDDLRLDARATTRKVV